MPETGTDYQRIFEQSPVNYIVVDLDYRIVAVTDSYLSMTMRDRDALVGTNIFEAFPDNPDDPNANGTQILRAGLDQAANSRTAEWLPGTQRYPIAKPADQGGGYEERWFRALNAPVLDSSGEVLYVIHGNEDVTESMRAD